jgi:branched-subunit amino acid transport protein AzlD
MHNGLHRVKESSLEKNQLPAEIILLLIMQTMGGTEQVRTTDSAMDQYSLTSVIVHSRVWKSSILSIWMIFLGKNSIDDTWPRGFPMV